jgi:hypothetical protein
MKRKLRDAGLLSLLIFLLFACKKEPDPCASLTPPKADFTMYLSNLPYGLLDKFYLSEPNDTLYYHPYAFGAMNVYFENTTNFFNEANWTVGGDVRTFTEPKFFLGFNGVSGAGERIDVELRTKRTAMKSPCFPNDDGLDTVRKSFFIANAMIHKPPQLGRFQGYIKGQERDTFTVNIELFQRQPNVTGDYMITNFPKGTTRGSWQIRPKIGMALAFYGRYFSVLSSESFDEFNQSGFEYCLGYAKNDSLFIEYKHRDGKPINFVGVRQ